MEEISQNSLDAMNDIAVYLNSHSIRLRNGVEMPQLGLSTFLIPEDTMTEAIGEAYKLGYRLFDTCGNERQLARALHVNRINREDVFITTKLDVQRLYWGGYRDGEPHSMNIRNFKSIKSMVAESFEQLDTDYMDLFLIHGACSKAPKIWLEFSRLYCQSRIRAVGVSNFHQSHLEALDVYSDIKPAINLFDISPLNTQKELIAYCRQHGIVVSCCGLEESAKDLMGNSILREIAARHNKSVMQIVLRWMQQQDIVIIAKTWDKKYLEESISIFDFELSNEEMKEIECIGF